MIQQVASSILSAGFTRLFFLNGHGGNRSPAGDALSELVATDDKADNAYLALASWWEVGAQGMRPDQLGLKQPVMSHACEYETSLMLVLRPDLVNHQKIAPRQPVLENDWFHSEDDSRKRVSVFRRFHRFTAEGGLGQPDAASAEKGRAILEGVVDEITSFLKDYALWQELPPLGPKNTR